MINKYVKIEDASEHDHPSHTWALGAVYQVGDWVWNNGVTFKVKVAHTATAELEPVLSENLSRIYRENDAAWVLNGANCDFDLANTPVVGSEEVYMDGKLMRDGGVDYTCSSASPHIVFAAGWASVLVPGVWIAVSYNKA